MHSDEIREAWDAEAAQFDDQPDHGLRDPAVRKVWGTLLRQHLPAAPARIADLGCGTGTLSVLMAEHGHDVDGVDLSPKMITRARAKARDLPLTFAEGDASAPDLPAAFYDVVLCRHVLWALLEPVVVLRRWVDLLRPAGRLVLVEGSWSTGAGLRADECVELLAAAGRSADVIPLRESTYWGREISDERYLVVSQS